MPFRPPRSLFPSLALACSLAALVLVGCGSSAPLLESAAAQPQPPRIDGSTADWGDSLQPLEDEPLTVGVRNDGEALYLAVVSSDADVVRHVFLTGLVVWLDASGEEDKSMGLHFPLGLIRDGALPDPGMLRQRGAEADRAAQLAEMLRELAVIQGDVRTVYDREALPGVEADASLAGGTLVLELKVPLGSGGPFAFDAAPGTAVSVGLETPELDREALRAQMRARMREGGAMRGGRRGGTGGGMRGSRGGERPSPPEPVEAWVRVALVD